MGFNEYYARKNSCISLTKYILASLTLEHMPDVVTLKSFLGASLRFSLSIAILFKETAVARQTIKVDINTHVSVTK